MEAGSGSRHRLGSGFGCGFQSGSESGSTLGSGFGAGTRFAMGPE